MLPIQGNKNIQGNIFTQIQLATHKHTHTHYYPCGGASIDQNIKAADRM